MTARRSFAGSFPLIINCVGGEARGTETDALPTRCREATDA